MSQFILTEASQEKEESRGQKRARDDDLVEQAEKQQMEPIDWHELEKDLYGEPDVPRSFLLRDLFTAAGVEYSTPDTSTSSCSDPHSPVHRSLSIHEHCLKSPSLFLQNYMARTTINTDLEKNFQDYSVHDHYLFIARNYLNNPIYREELDYTKHICTLSIRPQLSRL